MLCNYYISATLSVNYNVTCSSHPVAYSRACGAHAHALPTSLGWDMLNQHDSPSEEGDQMIKAGLQESVFLTNKAPTRSILSITYSSACYLHTHMIITQFTLTRSSNKLQSGFHLGGGGGKLQSWTM